MSTQEDNNLSFGDIPIKKNESATRTLFINTNGVDIGSDDYSLRELYTNSKAKQSTFFCYHKLTPIGKIRRKTINLKG